MDVSVVIASYNSKRTIERCLKSLDRQATSRRFEVLVIDSSADGTAELVKEKFPDVKIVHFPSRKFPGDARNIGIALARGRIIALIDADCEASKNWIEAIIKAHENPCPAVGGAIANGSCHGIAAWAAYFCEFSQWMPQTRTRWMQDIAAANMSYKKEVFVHYGRFLEGTYCSDTDFHWRLQAASGYKLRFVPSIVVSHHGIEKLGQFLKHEFFHGGSFARVRVVSKKFPNRRRWLYTFLSPLIAAKLFVKISLLNFSNRVYLQHFLKCAPILLLGVLSWTLGETAGYLDTRRQ